MKTSTKLLIAFILVLGFGTIVSANQSYFTISAQTATATTTVSQVSPGAGTTTLPYDSYVSSKPTALDSAVLLIQGTGSTTASVVSVTFQYSQDNIDWYDDESRYGTTTGTIDASVARTFLITQGTTRSGKAIPFGTYTRYVRAIVTGNTGTSTVWAQIVPKKEVTE